LGGDERQGADCLPPVRDYALDAVIAALNVRAEAPGLTAAPAAGAHHGEPLCGHGRAAIGCLSVPVFHF